MLNGGPVVLFDINGNQTATTPGSAAPAAAVQLGGSDGTNLRAVLTDTGGRQIAVGAAATGGAPTGNPVYIAGLDGTNLRALLTDTSGRQVMVGAAADGAAVAGNPVLIAGSDGANVQTLLTDASGRLEVNTASTASATSTLSNVAGSASSVSLLAANADRTGAIIVNDSTARLYAKFGATASTTSYTVLIAPGGYYEVPFNYTGAIDGIWSVANGAARITELEA